MQRREIHFYGIDDGESTIVVTPSNSEGYFTQENDEIQRPTLGQIALISGLELVDGHRMAADKDDSLLGKYLEADQSTWGYRAINRPENKARITVINGSLRNQRLRAPEIFAALQVSSDFVREFAPYRNLEEFGPL